MRSFILFLFFLPTFIYGQNYYQLDHITTDEFGFTDMPAVRVRLDKVDKQMAMEEWMKFLKKYSKSEMIEDENLIILKDVVIPQITSDPFHIYTAYQATREGVEIIVAVRDSFSHVDIQSHKNGYPVEREILNYLEISYLKQLNIELKEENKHLAELEKEEKKIQKDIDKLSKDRINADVDIEHYEKEIELNETAYDDILNDINIQKTIMAQTSKSDDSYKLVSKELSNYEKRKGDIEKEKKGLKTKIYDSHRKIEEYDKEVGILSQALHTMNNRIIDQRGEILTIEELIYVIEKG